MVRSNDTDHIEMREAEVERLRARTKELLISSRLVAQMLPGCVSPDDEERVKRWKRLDAAILSAEGFENEARLLQNQES